MSLYARVKRRARRELLARTARLRGSLKAAVIGCGQIAPAHLMGYQESGLATVVGVSDVEPGAMAAHLAHRPDVRAFRDYRQMLSVLRPDLVSICTWPQHHLEILRTVAEYPVKAVLCEKPMALQMHEVEEMLRVSKHGGIRLGIGHQYRFHPCFRKASELIRSGSLGRILSMKGNIADSIANNGPHLVDAIRFLLDDKPVRRVSASIEGMGSRVNRGWPAELGARGALTFEDGLTVEVFWASNRRRSSKSRSPARRDR
jgi:predicted dehydrogenase